MCDIFGIAKRKPKPENVCDICQCKDYPNCSEGQGDEQEMCHNCICKFSGAHFGNFDTSSESEQDEDESENE